MENAAQPTKEFAGFQGLNICAVGAVYKNDTPRHFRSALKSVFDQTGVEFDTHIVIDGPIGDELKCVSRVPSSLPHATS